MQTVIVIPTYNERDNLRAIVDKIFSYVNEADVLIVDDNSPDGTGALADQLHAEYGGRVLVIHRPQKEGLGRAYVAGFQEALDRGYDVIAQMDADLSHDPSYLPEFLNGIRQADLVLGSRYVHGINVVNWDFKRLLLSKLATWYVQLITRMPATDATGGYKCWRRQTLLDIDLDKVFSNGYLFQIEMTYKTFRKHLRIAEVPIIFYERNLGRSKMDWHIIAEAVWGVLKLRLQSLGRSRLAHGSNRDGSPHVAPRVCTHEARQ